jgi:hypothetical protein
VQPACKKIRKILPDERRFSNVPGRNILFAWNQVAVSFFFSEIRSASQMTIERRLDLFGKRCFAGICTTLLRKVEIALCAAQSANNLQ